jgi:hypothetical protein
LEEIEITSQLKDLPRKVVTIQEDPKEEDTNINDVIDDAELDVSDSALQIDKDLMKQKLAHHLLE